MPRIVTLTLNPAIDVAYDADAVIPDHKVRTRNETHDPGGGGVNVSRVLRELGAETLAIVLAGGVTGAHLMELLAAEGVPAKAVPIAAPTRICTTVHDLATRHEYRFLPEGPLVSAAERAACEAALAAEPADWLVLSGGLPRGAPVDIYARLARATAAKVVLDTSGPALPATIGAPLALIKPSLRELESIVGHNLPDETAQDAAVHALIAQGAAERIAVTLGPDGALLASRHGLIRSPAIPVDARSAVGAGDSFCAALTWALARGANDATALRWALAASAASVMNTGTAHPRRAVVEALFHGQDRQP